MQGETGESLVGIHPKIPIKVSRNKSCFFLLPLLGYGNTSAYYGFINCYLGDIFNKPDLDNVQRVFVHCKTYNTDLLSLDAFEQFYKLEDSSYMYVFIMPDRFYDDYNTFMAGKYSEMSDVAKATLIKATGVKPVINAVVYKVLWKTPDQRQKIEDMIGQPLLDNEEVFDKPNLDKELYQGPFGLFKSQRIELGEEI